MSKILPKELRAGSSLQWPITLTAYPAPDWSLSLYLRGPAGIDLTTTPDGVQHVLTASPATTANWTAGTYSYLVRVTDGVDIIDIDEGQIEVRADLAAITGEHDGRSHAQKVLGALEAVIEGRATIDQSSYKINNRELSRTPIPELIALRKYYRAEVLREKRKAAGHSPYGRPVKVRF